MIMGDEHDMTKSARVQLFLIGSTFHSFDLLRLQLDRLLIHEYPLALVRLGLPPLPDACRERVHRLLVDPFQQDPRRQRRASFHSNRYSQLNRMRVSHSQRHKVLAWILWFHCDG